MNTEDQIPSQFNVNDYAESAKQDEAACIEGNLRIDDTDVYSLASVENNNSITFGDFPQGIFESQTISYYREQIVDVVNHHPVVIINGPTGCGKTTKVPQYIFDDCREGKKLCKIVVTQPRRLAAITAANRVAEERRWVVGSIVGYHIGLNNTTSNDTSLTYMTTGVLLQQLLNCRSLAAYTHIILDEVHERDQDMDFTLLVIRRLLQINPCSTKVILMSATLQAQEFSEYFTITNINEGRIPPVLRIPVNTGFVVVDSYLNEFQKKLVNRPPDFFTFDINIPGIRHELYDILKKLIQTFDQIDKVDLNITDDKQFIPRSVLIFLPGLNEINEAFKALTVNPNLTNAQKIKWLLIPLHSMITEKEQRSAFQKPLKGTRKIILSTNIAESSITVPDIAYVIDFCLRKVVLTDPETGYTYFKTVWASQNCCTQRKGRVGRVAHGRCYRMVSRFFYEGLPRQIEPAILRCPLDRLVLQTKLLEPNEPPHSLLSMAMNPPDLSNIERTICSLKEIGALLPTCENNLNGDLTYIGRVMAALPLDMRLSRLILLGHMFGCLRDCIIIASGMHVQGVFRTQLKESHSSYSNKLMWAFGSCSDLLALLNVYTVWLQRKEENYFTNRKQEKKWCRDSYIQPKSLIEWHNTVEDITNRLKRFNIDVNQSHDPLNTSKQEMFVILMVVISGTYYPNYFLRLGKEHQGVEIEAGNHLSGNDLFTTVYFTGFDSNQPGPVYTKKIKNLLKDIGGKKRVYFGPGTHSMTQRAYVQFDSESTSNKDDEILEYLVHGRIPVEVYYAARLGKENQPRVINVVPRERLHRYMRTLINIRKNSDSEIEPPPDHICTQQMCLKGPYSPLEVRLVGTKYSTGARYIKINANSVNVVLLDTNPEDPHDRLVVATAITQNVRRDALYLGNTNVMPNIHGFAVLMALIFCPKTELHFNDAGTQITDILCGLGYHPQTIQSLYPQNDISLFLDVELTSDDLKTINEIRCLMNCFVHNSALRLSDSRSQNWEQNITGFQKGLIYRTLQLLKKERKYVKKCSNNRSFFWGFCTDNVQVLAPPYAAVKEEIWPLHSVAVLKPTDVHADLKQHLSELSDMVANKAWFSMISCKLCNVDVFNVDDLKHHITMDEEHQQKVRNLYSCDD